MQLILHLWLAIFFSLTSIAVAQTSNFTITNQTICNGTFAGDPNNHTRYEYNATLFSSPELRSCENGDPTMAIYWFSYDDVCRFNDTRYTSFAIIDSNGILNCINRSKINITEDSCRRDYNFTRQSMTINNITNLTPKRYICFLSNSQALMNYSSTRIYSINIIEPTTSTSTSLSTTASTSNTTQSNIGNSTTTQSNSSGNPGTSLILKIVLPVVLGVVFIIVVIIVGVCCYRRRQRKRQFSKKPVKYKLEQVPAVRQRQAIFGEDISTVESDHGSSVWRPV